MLKFFRRRYFTNLPVRWLHYCRVHAESKKGGMDRDGGRDMNRDRDRGMDRGGGLDRERGIAMDRDGWTKR